MNKLVIKSYDTYYMARLTGATHSQAMQETYSVWHDLDKAAISAYIASQGF